MEAKEIRVLAEPHSPCLIISHHDISGSSAAGANCRPFLL